MEHVRRVETSSSCAASAGYKPIPRQEIANQARTADFNERGFWADALNGAGSLLHNFDRYLCLEDLSRWPLSRRA